MNYVKHNGCYLWHVHQDRFAVVGHPVLILLLSLPLVLIAHVELVALSLC